MVLTFMHMSMVQLFRTRLTQPHHLHMEMQLISRQWIITNADGEVEVIKGPGVIGEQPVLPPGSSFEYTSYCPLKTTVGAMQGSYQMVTADGERFDAEIAPFTLSEAPHELPAARRAELRRIVQDHGVAITGLHYLLLAPAGLSITSPDHAVRARTVDVMRALIGLCADLGGRILVHGSPGQRRVAPGQSQDEALAFATECFSAIALDAEQAGVSYCIEPLAPPEAELINTIEEAAAIDGCSRWQRSPQCSRYQQRSRSSCRRSDAERSPTHCVRLCLGPIPRP